MFNGLFHMVDFMHNGIECRMPSKIVCFWLSNINNNNNNQPKCDGLFGFTMHRPFHLLIPAHSGIRQIWCSNRPTKLGAGFYFPSFSYVFFSSKAQLLIYFIRKTSNKNSAIHLNPTINVYAFDGNLINFSMWTMQTTQSTLCQFHVQSTMHTHIIFCIDAWNKNDFNT